MLFNIFSFEQFQSFVPRSLGLFTDQLHQQNVRIPVIYPMTQYVTSLAILGLSRMDHTKRRAHLREVGTAYSRLRAQVYVVHSYVYFSLTSFCSGNPSYYFESTLKRLIRSGLNSKCLKRVE